MDVGASLVTGGAPTKPRELGEGAFHHPAMATEMRGPVDPLAGDAGHDVSGAARHATSAAVIALSACSGAGPRSRPTATAGSHARNSVEDGRQGDAVVTVRSDEDQAERYAPPVGDNVALCPLLGPCPSGWVPSRHPPFGSDRGAVDQDSRLVEMSGLVQPLQQHLVQAVPDPGSLPVPHPAPARHPRAPERLAR